MAECTPRALILGTLLGVVFGASSLYLMLKVGMTVSASIPVAVISLTLFRLWAKVAGGRDATILENNIVQTAGSAGESIAFGLGATMPAILILGYDLEMTRVVLVGLLGAWLGILMMIPLRRALIVQQHHELKYPEGTACAEVLKAGDEARRRGEAARARAARRFSPALASGCFTRRPCRRSRRGRTRRKKSLARLSTAARFPPKFRRNFGRRLCDRPAHFRHHGRRRGAVVSGADSPDQIFRGSGGVVARRAPNPIKE
jgi:hypothetical protein